MKKFIAFCAVLFCCLNLCAKEVITDWKNRTLGEKATPSWVIYLFEKDNVKKFKKDFDLKKDDIIFYATEESNISEAAVAKASLKVKSDAAKAIGEKAKNPKAIVTIANLKKVTDFWIKIEGNPDGTYYKAYAVYKISKQDYNFLINNEVKGE